MYCTRKITDELYWVGANDHRTRLFENIHPIPRGVSYNAYLLLDQQTALLDTADWSVCRQLMENLEHLLAGRPLDWVVLHHMESDHAASLQVILDRWPQVKIAASAQAFRLLEQFGFQTGAHARLELKEGDSLSLGRHSLQFFAAPMVHWPEVLVSYDAADGTLFSADAFGTFGALDGKLFADEVDFPRDWLDDARRYYANIVGKYGVQVQALLKKAAGLDLKRICPLHGPVWRQELAWFVDKHDRWSRWEPEEKGVLIAYASMYGNTESAAQALAAALVERGVGPVEVRDLSAAHVSELMALSFRLSHIVLAAPTYNGGVFPPMEAFLEDMKALGLKNRTFAVLDNGSWAPAAGKAMAAALEALPNSTLLEPRLSIKSSLGGDRAGELEALAQAIAESVH